MVPACSMSSFWGVASILGCDDASACKSAILAALVSEAITRAPGWREASCRAFVPFPAQKSTILIGARAPVAWHAAAAVGSWTTASGKAVSTPVSSPPGLST